MVKPRPSTAGLCGLARWLFFSVPLAKLPGWGPPPLVPFTCHVTAGLDVLATAAVNFFVPKTGTKVLVGVTDIWAPWAVWLAANGEPELAHPQDVKPIPRNRTTDNIFRKQIR